MATDVRIPHRKMGLCSGCGKLVELWYETKNGARAYFIDAHASGDNTHALCQGSNERPIGEPMRRHIIERPENERRQKPKGVTLGW